MSRDAIPALSSAIERDLYESSTELLVALAMKLLLASTVADKRRTSESSQQQQQQQQQEKKDDEEEDTQPTTSLESYSRTRYSPRCTV